METVTLFALILFPVTYVVMMAFQKIRPHAAVISALIFVIVGSVGLFPGFSYSPLEALKEIAGDAKAAADKTEGAAQDVLKAVGDSVRTLADKVKDTFEQVKGDAAEAFEAAQKEAEQQAKAAADAAEDAVEDAVDNAARKADEAADAAKEIINLEAIMNLPKGTEHFLADIHGENEAFEHVLKNASGNIAETISEMFETETDDDYADEETGE